MEFTGLLPDVVVMTQGAPVCTSVARIQEENAAMGSLVPNAHIPKNTESEKGIKKKILEWNKRAYVVGSV